MSDQSILFLLYSDAWLTTSKWNIQSQQVLPSKISHSDPSSQLVAYVFQFLHSPTHFSTDHFLVTLSRVRKMSSEIKWLAIGNPRASDGQIH